VQQEQQNKTHAEIARLMSREPEQMLQEMLVAIGHGLSDLPCYEDGEDGEDNDDERTEQCKLTEDDEPGWVMGTNTISVH
jgi:hypothetical protein